jgi:hypothetical protein
MMISLSSDSESDSDFTKRDYLAMEEIIEGVEQVENGSQLLDPFHLREPTPLSIYSDVDYEQNKATEFEPSEKNDYVQTPYQPWPWHYPWQFSYAPAYHTNPQCFFSQILHLSSSFFSSEYNTKK